MHISMEVVGWLWLVVAGSVVAWGLYKATMEVIRDIMNQYRWPQRPVVKSGTRHRRRVR